MLHMWILQISVLTFLQIIMFVVTREAIYLMTQLLIFNHLKVLHYENHFTDLVQVLLIIIYKLQFKLISDVSRSKFFLGGEGRHFGFWHVHINK